MNGINKNIKIFGVSRVRNVDFIINDVLNHLDKIIDGVIIYDDASTDNTLEILKKHPLVIDIIENKEWESDKYIRKNAEGDHRQLLFNEVKKHSPDWIYVFDADEFLEFDDEIDLTDNSYDSYFFRLFDYYITPYDIKKPYKDREFIGPEYRDIPMLFRGGLDLRFKARVPIGFNSSKFGGYVKHYGKAISIEEWDKKCNYYIDHLIERQPGGNDISDKWFERKGKAVHTKSDFNNKLIKWEDKNLFEVELTNDLEKLSSLELTILVANDSLENLGGSETFTYSIIEELIKYPKFKIEYFTFKKGEISNNIEEVLGVKFMSLKKYDLILANHFTVVNKLYKFGFIIQTCHGIYPKLEQPNRKANGFIAISQEVQDHLVKKGFLSKIIYNSINLNRFYPKKDIKIKPKKILSLCHSEEANKVIKNLCQKLDIEYLEAYKYNNAIWNVEDLINQADLVFGLGRSAYEAMACGRPVVIFDNRKYFPSYGDGYVKDVLGFSIINNCSGRYSKRYFTLEDLKIEIYKYNYTDQYFFREFAKKELDVRKNIVKYIEYFILLKKHKNDKQFKTKVKKYFKNVLKLAKKIVRKLINFINYS
jgi:hypothetical protein